MHNTSEIMVNNSRNPTEQLIYKVKMLSIIKVDKMKGPNFDKILISFGNERCCRQVFIFDRRICT